MSRAGKGLCRVRSDISLQARHRPFPGICVKYLYFNNFDIMDVQTICIWEDGSGPPPPLDQPLSKLRNSGTSSSGVTDNDLDKSDQKCIRLLCISGLTLSNSIEYCFTSFSAHSGNIATEGSPEPGLCPTLI